MPAGAFGEEKQAPVGVISKDRHGYTWMENLSVYCLQDNIYEMK